MIKQLIVQGIPVTYDESGNPDAEAVILMHGWGCNKSTVASIAKSMEPLHVFNIDLPGHGDTPEPSQIWGVEDYTHLIEDFISRLDIHKPIIAGHSFGGRISILLASRKDVAKVILIDAAGVKPRRKLDYYIKVYSFKLMKHVLPALLGKKTGQKLIDKWRGKAGSADYRQSTPIMRGILSKCVNEDLKHAMPSITAPTLLVWGANDTATPLQDAKIMENLIPDAGLVCFEGCGHYSFLDNPIGFKAVIREFLKKDIESAKKSAE